MDKINVLDKGYVRLIDTMGTDLSVVNTARVSFDKETQSLEERDIRLIEFLVKNKHTSTLRHCVMSFEIYAPLCVARQWYKHAVASAHLDDQSGWNETSRRYVTENEEFYVPENFLSAPTNKKQGSGLAVDEETNQTFRLRLTQIQKAGIVAYEEAMNAGIAPEQARLFLPAYGMYVRWRWTPSLNALLNFLSQRLDEHAQWEIREYAKAILPFVEETFGYTYNAWVRNQ